MGYRILSMDGGGSWALIEVRAGAFDVMRAMGHFMGGFFLVFSFFKLLNLSGFADAYRTYDVLAKVWPGSMTGVRMSGTGASVPGFLPCPSGRLPPSISSFT